VSDGPSRVVVEVELGQPGVQRCDAPRVLAVQFGR